MKELPFVKAVASGNDFVILDNRKLKLKNVLALAPKICDRHNGIGADGILLFEPSRKADFKMRIVNSDGSEAEACGNGFRCIALYANQKQHHPKKFKFEAMAGIIQAEVKNGRIRVELSKPNSLKLNQTIQVEGHRLHYSFINTGVPHTVIFVEGLEKIDVEKLGRAIRWHSQFAPKGTNVNFVEVKGKQQIQVRTYERGVENETLACGTGSTASALISCLLGYVKAPVQVKTKGGEILTVTYNGQGNSIGQVMLEGEAQLVYEGKYKV